MARRTSRNARKQEVDEKELKKQIKVVLKILDDYGVSLDEKIRFKMADNPDGTWTKGRVIGINKDCSLDVITDGPRRAFVPGGHAIIQVSRTGPRGGKYWVDILDANK